jgi:Flp pilus assembly protein TadG
MSPAMRERVSKLERVSEGRHERGQTLVLVAISLVALMAMAALAIDVVTLYVARGQAERAADAAALAAAKLLADAGVTTDPGDGSGIWSNACASAVLEAQTVAAQNEVAGMYPTSGQVMVTFPNAGSGDCSGASSVFGINPQAQVVVQVSGVPTFFARIWSAASSTVKGTALAEAYNPSNSSSVSGLTQTVPIAPRCVKPLLLPNCDKDHLVGTSPCGDATFISPSNGTITNPGLATKGGVIGEQLMLTANCTGNGTAGCAPGTPAASEYYPLSISSVSSSTATYFCPNCFTAGDAAFQQDLECCNGNVLQCGTPSTGQSPVVDATASPNGGQALNGGQCLIHETSTIPPIANCDPLTDEDCLDISSPPQMVIRAGNRNPLIGQGPVNVQAGDPINTSASVVTLPLYDGVATPTVGVGVTIIGFLQAFINYVDTSPTTGAAQIHITVLNVSGCGGGAGSPPVTGVPVIGAGTAVPVRLISSSATSSLGG